MEPALAPIRSPSLKEVFIKRFEGLILSGEFAIGQRLPPERELAQQLGVSRPVVHEGLVELAARGLVVMRPRVGTYVCDYRREGSLAVLNSLVSHHQGSLDPGLLAGLLDMRRLFETETARLAARNRSDDDLTRLRELLGREDSVDQADTLGVAELDFEFHHLITLASRNPLYPMLIKSFEPAYKNLTRQFFTLPETLPRVFEFHTQLVEAIAESSADRAAEVMDRLLAHGSTMLWRVLDRKPQSDERAR